MAIDQEAVRRALAAAAKHPVVREVENVTWCDDGSSASAEITFDVALPNEWRSAGKSPENGVGLTERVRFEFPMNFPLAAPRLSLRLDFSRRLPHIQPYMTDDGRPVPCIYDGDLNELIHGEGWSGLLDHLAAWLERAAMADLIDAEQGWEPVRRDCYRDWVLADESDIQRIVDRRGGVMFRRTTYLRVKAQGGTAFVYSQILPQRVQVNKETVPSIFQEWPMFRDGSAFVGKSLAILVWPGKHPSGDLIVSDTYLPETVSNIRELRQRAVQYGCRAELNDGFSIVRRGFKTYAPNGPFALVVILLARRPCHLIGNASDIEMCPYVVDVRSPDLFAEGDSTEVHIAAHRHQISRSLLAQMAGESHLVDPPNWTLLGAGSLGSKVAVHLARAGRGPRVVVDRSTLSPHNVARHALLPAKEDFQVPWTRGKAVALAVALQGLQQQARAVTEDVASITGSPAKRRLLGRSPWAIINATASLTVQEALASADALPATRVIEIGLYAGGRVGVVTVEGPARNPNTLDLVAESYRLLASDQSVGEVVFSEAGSSRQHVGQGCGSLTMAMSDGRLSLFAAAMAEYLLCLQRAALPSEGEVLIGRLSDEGLGLAWRSFSAGPTTVVGVDRARWQIRVGQNAKRKIEEEAQRHPNVETGGVLIGRLSEVNRSVHVVDVLDAPEDSRRSNDQFVLGVKGLRAEITNYTKSVGGAIYCVGTWHSHLTASGPSSTDAVTAKSFSYIDVSPSVLLIHTPDGFCGMLADVR